LQIKYSILRFFKLVAASGVLLISCENHEPPAGDVLTEEGLLGYWEVSSRTVNGQRDPSVDCCEFLALDADADANDLWGQWSYTKDTFTQSGTFQVDTALLTMWFYTQNSSFIKEYEVGSYDVLGLANHVGSNYIGEIWRRK
jgi:hypothetical protein